MGTTSDSRSQLVAPNSEPAGRGKNSSSSGDSNDNSNETAIGLAPGSDIKRANEINTSKIDTDMLTIIINHHTLSNSCFIHVLDFLC